MDRGSRLEAVMAVMEAVMAAMEGEGGNAGHSH